MERRFTETLFGAEHLLAEAEDSLVTRSAVVGEAKMTVLWKLRTSFGPRGSRPQPLKDLPPEVQVGLFSMFGVGLDGNSEARSHT
jgi:hypothetical protein